jgi:mRNA interferase RelE/StbE
MYEVLIANPAKKGFKHLPHEIRYKAAALIKSLGIDPRPEGCRKLVETDDLWRLRVGDYRIVYQIDKGEKTVLIKNIRHRKEVYRNVD